MMDQVGVGCPFTSHLLNEKEQTTKERYLPTRYKEGVKSAHIRQQCVAVNAKTMITSKKLYFYVTQRLIECALLHMSKHALMMITN